MRGSLEYLQSLTTSKTIEDEIDQLTLRYVSRDMHAVISVEEV
jgi:hypothetical protein